ncbi:hypothetical protein HHI36_000345 [Cryptolaemus montrouzieri]|uniref:Uncharacterized protein n=1 Tax=Cryptolaemus montrouzieri TaxID=559131 RepID=A0ABD2P4C4_9CUCU
MSKKISAKDNLPEDNVDSPFPIRRSNRISLSQNSSTPNSKPVKSITTRRSSASSLETQNGNVEAGSPFVEKRRTRRTSTDSDTKPTPIRTRRSSASKILEEEKKLQTAPNTPTRRSTRAVSTSPSKSTDIPARRTRRSVSREVEISEELPLPVRRSSRRSSVDAQENATNEQALEKPKKNTRRLRSASIDELEEKAKKPLEPIEELENISEETKNEEKKGLNLSTIEEFGDSDSEKSNTSQDKTKESKRIRKRLSGDDQLVSIKLKENGMDESEASDCENTTEDNRILEINAEGTKDMDKSEKILKELDEVLESKISSPKKKSAIPDNTRSIFSPITPRKFDAPEQKLLDKEEENKERNLDKSRDETFGKSDGETLGRVTKQSSDNKEEKNTSPLKRKRGSLEGQDSATSKEESVKSVEDTESIKEKKRAVDVKDKMHISMGSDDSFTLHMNMTLDKTQFPQGEDDDNVFSSPGSNKENSSINVSLNKISDKKELEIANKGISVFTASVPARKSFYEPMEVDEDDLPSSIVKDTKTASPTKTKRFSLNNASPKIGRDVQNQKDTNKPLLGSNNGSNKEHSISSETEEIKKGSNELVEEGKFTHINSFQSDKEKMTVPLTVQRVLFYPH